MIGITLVRIIDFKFYYLGIKSDNKNSFRSKKTPDILGVFLFYTFYKSKHCIDNHPPFIDFE